MVIMYNLRRVRLTVTDFFRFSFDVAVGEGLPREHFYARICDENHVLGLSAPSTILSSRVENTSARARKAAKNMSTSHFPSSPSWKPSIRQEISTRVGPDLG